MKPDLRLITGGNHPTPDTSDNPRRTGSFIWRWEWCEDCGTWTRQARKILAAIAGTRECSSYWHCTGHGGQIDD